MKITRLFTGTSGDPYEGIEWSSRESEIRNPDGGLIFQQKDVVVPSGWSQIATDIMAQKYFRRAGVPDGRAQREERTTPGRSSIAWPKPGVTGERRPGISTPRRTVKPSTTRSATCSPVRWEPPIHPSGSIQGFTTPTESKVLPRGTTTLITIRVS